MAEQHRVVGSGAPSSHAARCRALGGALAAAALLAACGGGATATTGGAASTADQSVSSAATTTTATADPTAQQSPSPQPPTAAPPSSTALPAIAVEAPLAGAKLHSPFHVTGSADTFEGVFRLQLRDPGGTVLLDQQVQATSGTGTRGRFDATVTTSARGSATLVLFERSARDGSPVNTVTVAISLA